VQTLITTEHYYTYLELTYLRWHKEDSETPGGYRVASGYTAYAKH